MEAEERARENREARRAELLERLSFLTDEKERMLKESDMVQKKLASVMFRRQHAAADDAKDRGTVTEMTKRYQETLKQVIAAKEVLTKLQNNYNRQAVELQERFDDKDATATEIADSFMEFKREIARAAENSRTGKSIPRKIVAQFELTEKKKDEEVEKVRLQNINLRTKLRKLEQNLHEKEQLAEGLHLIDFEQLKIENQTLNEKIEERNEELHKLRKKTTTTVQVLTHIKEKLQFVQAENLDLKKELGALDAKLTGERDKLTKSKHERDRLRAENDKLRQQQGFVNSKLLVKDFESRKHSLAEMEERVNELKTQHAFLMEQARAREERRNMI